MNTSIPNSERLDYLDAARAFALILGIIFHASISFMPIFIGWAVMDISTSSLVPHFMLVSHSFRLALFFLIAGFFSHMKFHREGLDGFMKARLIRIAVPFIIGWFLLRPLLVSGWVMGAESMRGEVNILNGLQAGFVTLAELPKDLFLGTHLWFLYYLLLISLSVVLMRYFLKVYKPVGHHLIQLIDKVMVWLCSSHLSIITLAIPTAACLWFMSHWGLDTPDKSLIPLIPVALVYGGFFMFGWLLQRQSLLLENFARLTWTKCALSLVAIIATMQFSSFEMQSAYAHYNLFKTGFVISYAIMMWSLVSLTIGLFKRCCNRPNKTLRYFADSSYWLYLIHLPIVIWLQIACAELPLHWSIKLVCISTLTVVIAMLLYDAFIRATYIGAVLNGKRKSRVLFYTKNGI